MTKATPQPQAKNDPFNKHEDFGSLDARQSARLQDLDAKDQRTAEEDRELEDLRHDSKLKEDKNTAYVREGSATIYVTTDAATPKEKLVKLEEGKAVPGNVVTLTAEEFDKRFDAPLDKIEQGNPANSQVQGVKTNSETGVNPNASKGDQ